MLSLAGSVGDALVEHFFGPNKDRLLTVDAFQEFHSRLRLDVLKLEVRTCREEWREEGKRRKKGKEEWREGNKGKVKKECFI